MKKKHQVSKDDGTTTITTITIITTTIITTFSTTPSKQKYRNTTQDPSSHLFFRFHTPPFGSLNTRNGHVFTRVGDICLFRQGLREC